MLTSHEEEKIVKHFTKPHKVITVNVPLLSDDIVIAGNLDNYYLKAYVAYSQLFEAFQCGYYLNSRFRFNNSNAVSQMLLGEHYLTFKIDNQPVYQYIVDLITKKAVQLNVRIDDIHINPSSLNPISVSVTAKKPLLKWYYYKDVITPHNLIDPKFNEFIDILNTFCKTARQQITNKQHELLEISNYYTTEEVQNLCKNN